jgi:hypothetical protein
MRERKIGITFRRALQQLVGAGVGRQQQVDRRHIEFDGLGGTRGDGQIEAVLHFEATLALVRSVTVTLPVVRQQDIS